LAQVVPRRNRAKLKLAPGPVGAYYRHLLRAKGKPKATSAAARKLRIYLYWMLNEEWTYAQWLDQHQASRRPDVRPSQRLGAMA
jgi:predicted cupin superfamily sugar epimerase